MRIEELLNKLARSDVIIEPVIGLKNLLVVAEAGCVFIGPEKWQQLNLRINTNRSDSDYRLKELVQQGALGTTFISLFSIPDWNYEIHRENSSLPNFPGYRQIPWELYKAWSQTRIEY